MAAPPEIVEQWRGWIEREVVGPPEKKESVFQVVAMALARKASAEEVVSIAQRSSRAWDASDAPAQGNFAVPPTSTVAGHSKNEYGGIIDVVAADKSEIGKATVSAVNAVNIDNLRMRWKPFFATKGFRTRFGFEKSFELMGLFLKVALIAYALFFVFSAAAPFFRPSPDYKVAKELALIAFNVGSYSLVAIAGYMFLAIFTSMLLARTVRINISNGRLAINYGLFSTRQIAIEIHWIREVDWQQSFCQKLLGEASIRIAYDTASRDVRLLHLPGLVAPKDTQQMVDRLRNAAQKLRQGNYYAKSFIG